MPEVEAQITGCHWKVLEESAHNDTIPPTQDTWSGAWPDHLLAKDIKSGALLFRPVCMFLSNARRC